jgi:hypothetical protein
MPTYTLEELRLIEAYETYEDLVEDQAYFLYEGLVEKRNNEQEGLVYLFREWLDLISPSDFGNDEGLEGILV